MSPHDPPLSEEVLTPHDTRYLFVLPFSTDLALARRFLARDQDVVGNIRFGKLLETLDKIEAGSAAEASTRASDRRTGNDREERVIGWRAP